MSQVHDSAVERLDVDKSSDRLQVALHQQRYDFVLARVSPEDSVLGVGTGRGFFSRMVVGRCKQFAGLEYDAGACKATRSRLRGRGAVFQGDAQAMLFPSASFSVIVCLEVLEHLADYRMALGEIHRCLRPGGRAVISVPYRRRGGPNPTNRFHLYEPGEKELVAALREYFSQVETFYQYFEERAWMTLARVLHLRSFLGLAPVYRDLALGTPQTTARLRIAAKAAGWKINLVLVAADPRVTQRTWQA